MFTIENVCEPPCSFLLIQDCGAPPTSWAAPLILCKRIESLWSARTIVQLAPSFQQLHWIMNLRRSTDTSLRRWERTTTSHTWPSHQKPAGQCFQVTLSLLCSLVRSPGLGPQLDDCQPLGDFCCKNEFLGPYPFSCPPSAFTLHKTRGTVPFRERAGSEITEGFSEVLAESAKAPSQPFTPGLASTDRIHGCIARRNVGQV